MGFPQVPWGLAKPQTPQILRRGARHTLTDSFLWEMEIIEGQAFTEGVQYGVLLPSQARIGGLQEALFMESGGSLYKEGN